MQEKPSLMDLFNRSSIQLSTPQKSVKKPKPIPKYHDFHSAVRSKMTHYSRSFPGETTSKTRISQLQKVSISEKLNQ
jgi:hypothetical protein